MNLKEKEQMKGADKVEEATNIRRRCLRTLTRIDLTGERQGDKRMGICSLLLQKEIS